MIFLIAWMCLNCDNSAKNETQGSAVSKKEDSKNATNNSGESDSKADIKGSNNTGQATNLVQTEMYLAREQLQVSRPTVYHNFDTSKPLLSTSVTSINERPNGHECNLVTTSFNHNHAVSPNTNAANTANLYDLLIIDSKLSNNADEEMMKQAILLIDDHQAQNHQTHPTRFDSGACRSQRGLSNRRTLGCGNIIGQQQFSDSPAVEEQHHVGSMIHLHPGPEHENNTILRAVYRDKGTDKDCPNFHDQNAQIMSTSKGSNSPKMQTFNDAKIDKYSRGQCEFIDLDCRTHQHQLIRSPIGIVTSVASQIPGRYNATGFELNSLGELTVTDESSSFMQEEGAIDTQLNPSQSVCNRWRIDNNIRQQDMRSANLYKPTSGCCVECQRITPNNTPSDDHQSSGSVSLLPKSVNFNAPPTSNQASTLRRLVTSSENESKRGERVRFVDNGL